LLSDNKTNVSSGNITEGIKVENAKEKVIEFILQNLQEFRDNFLYKKIENGLTQELVYLLDNKEYKINNIIRIGISKEHMENTNKGNSPQDDIAIRAKNGIFIKGIYYADNEPFIVFEAKRLDANIPNYDDRKKEYVVGRIKSGKYLNSGGIERFKKEIHGKKLNHVGMIGYMQTDTFEIWLERINSYIDEEIVSASSKELTWEQKDKLVIDKTNKIYQTFKSEHKCISNKNLNIYHIWMNLI